MSPRLHAFILDPRHDLIAERVELRFDVGELLENRCRAIHLIEPDVPPVLVVSADPARSGPASTSSLWSRSDSGGLKSIQDVEGELGDRLRGPETLLHHGRTPRMSNPSSDHFGVLRPYTFWALS